MVCYLTICEWIQRLVYKHRSRVVDEELEFFCGQYRRLWKASNFPFSVLAVCVYGIRCIRPSPLALSRQNGSGSETCQRGGATTKELFWISCHAHCTVQVKNGHDYSILPRATMVIRCRSGPAGQPVLTVWSFGNVLGWIGGFPWLGRPNLLETERTSTVGRILFLEAETDLCSISMRFFFSFFHLQSGLWYRCVLYSMYIPL